MVYFVLVILSWFYGILCLGHFVLFIVAVTFILKVSFKPPVLVFILVIVARVATIARIARIARIAPISKEVLLVVSEQDVHLVRLAHERKRLLDRLHIVGPGKTCARRLDSLDCSLIGALDDCQLLDARVVEPRIELVVAQVYQRQLAPRSVLHPPVGVGRALTRLFRGHSAAALATQNSP
jgi:hypothetical protein